MSFLKKAIGHAEVKRGVSHLLVGVLIGLVSAAVFGDSSDGATTADDSD